MFDNLQPPSLLAQFVAGLPHVLIVAGPDGRVREWTPAALDLFGADEARMRNQHLSRWYGAEAELDLMVASAAGSAEREASVPVPSGEWRKLHIVVQALRDHAGGLLGFGVYAREPEPKPHDHTAALLRLLDAAGDALLLFDSEGRVLLATDACGALFGCDHGSLGGRRFDDPTWALRDAAGAEFTLPIVAVQRTGEAISIAGLTCNGVPLTLRAVPLGESAQVVVALRDETESRRFLELRAVVSYRGELELRQMEAEEQERRRLARELHDEAGQSLALVRKCILDEAPERALDALDALGSELRRITHDLRPAPLDTHGLGTALAMLVERFSSRSGIAVDYFGIDLTQRFPAHIENALYRIVQEMLTNIARHSGATEARLRVWQDAEGLGARMEDSGRGFDPDILVSGSGLAGMQSRAELLGGEFRVVSAPGAGTRIDVSIPLLELGEAS